MLNQLYSAGEHMEVLPPGYSISTVHWSIDIPDGDITQLTSTDNKGKTRPGKRMKLPDFRKGQTPIAVSDTGEYVFGFGSRGKDYHRKWMEMMMDFATQTKDEAIIAILDWFESVDYGGVMTAILETNPKASPEKERYIFTYDGESIIDRPLFKEYWEGVVSSQLSFESVMCAVTGDVAKCLSGTMPKKIKGIPNTQTFGAALVSFDKRAYRSYGFNQGQNAPIAYLVASQALAVLEAFLNSPYNHVRLKGETLIFWGNNDEGLNPEFCSNPASAMAAGLFVKHPHSATPEMFDESSSSEFFFARLKGAVGRVAVQEFTTHSPKHIQKNALRFCELQRLIKGYGGNTDPTPIWKLREVAFVESAKKDASNNGNKDAVDASLWNFALFGKPIPEHYAKKIIRRFEAEQNVSIIGCRGLSLYLGSNMIEISDDELAYRIGRIAFLIHMAENKARGTVETRTLRSLKNLASTPATTLPALLSGCISHHLIDENKTGWIRNLMTKEWQALGDYTPDSLPRVFTTRQQAQFFIGWGVCQGEFFTKKEDKNTDTQEEE